MKEKAPTPSQTRRLKRRQEWGKYFSCSARGRVGCVPSVLCEGPRWLISYDILKIVQYLICMKLQ